MVVGRGCIDLTESQDIVLWGMNPVQYMHFHTDKNYGDMRHKYLMNYKKNSRLDNLNIRFHFDKILARIMLNIDHRKEYIKFRIQDD